MQTFASSFLSVLGYDSPIYNSLAPIWLSSLLVVVVVAAAGVFVYSSALRLVLLLFFQMRVITLKTFISFLDPVFLFRELAEEEHGELAVHTQKTVCSHNETGWRISAPLTKQFCRNQINK